MSGPKQVPNPQGFGGELPLQASDLDNFGTMMVFNNSGSQINVGQVVAANGIDSNNRMLAITNATLNSVAVIGVALENIPSGSFGMICTGGLCLVNTPAGLVANTLVSGSATAGLVQSATAVVLGAIVGIFLGYTTGTTVGMVFVKLA